MSACSVRLCPSLPCNPLHLSPSSGLLWPPLPCAILCPSSSFDFEKHKLFGVYGGVILKMCPPFVSLLVSALFRWPCNISIHLSPRSVSASPTFSAGHVAFLFIRLPGLSLLVSALFRWPCRISIHVSPSSVTAGVRPFPLAM